MLLSVIGDQSNISISLTCRDLFSLDALSILKDKEMNKFINYRIQNGIGAKSTISIEFSPFHIFSFNDIKLTLPIFAFQDNRLNGQLNMFDFDLKIRIFNYYRFELTSGLLCISTSNGDANWQTGVFFFIITV